MSNTVELRLEAGDRKRNPDVYTKIITMPSAPTIGLQLSEKDVVLTINRLQYDMPTKTYYALIIESSSDKDEWLFMEKNGWKRETKDD